MSCTLITEDDLKVIKSESQLKVPDQFISPHRKSSSSNYQLFKTKVMDLPRGGTIIETSVGNIQFGLPPDTVKDTLNLGLDVPTYYILPSDRFDRRFGLNVAEFEFPAYFNFFIKKRKVKLICTEEAETAIRIVFQETLLGPEQSNVDGEGLNKQVCSCLPNFFLEGKYFSKNPFNPKEPLTIDTLLEFSIYDQVTKKAHVDGDVYVQLKDGLVNVIDRGIESACIEDKVYIGVPEIYESYDIQNVQHQSTLVKPVINDHFQRRLSGFINFREEISNSGGYFVPPALGITVLGNSHGFDPKGTTSGYVFWINGRGVMVDPPPFSSMILKDVGIPNHLIEAVIITHCHADHDSGTFQKILDSSRVEIITTNTIMQSFIRKYSALSGMKKDYIQSLFKFRQAIIGKPLKIHGASFNFFYSFHTIPCIGFELKYNEQCIYFSGDTFYDPEMIQELVNRQVMSQERANTIIKKNWSDYTLIIHEAGIPPIHTPLKILKALPDQDVPSDIGIRVAPEGIQNTLVLCQNRDKSMDLLEKLNLLSSIPLLERLSIRTIKDLLEVANEEYFKPEEIVIQEGSIGDKFYIIQSGIALIKSEKNQFQTHFLAGDYFGEKGVLYSDNFRGASVVAVTQLALLSVDRQDFKYIFGDELQGTAQFIKNLFNINEVRKSQFGNILQINMPSSQKIHFEAILQETKINKGQYLWKIGESAENSYFVVKGQLTLEVKDNELQELEEGILICDLNSILEDKGHSCNLIANEDVIAYEIHKEDLVQFVNKYPGFRLLFTGVYYLD